MPTPSRDLVLGIDFGTSYTSAAALVDGRVAFVVDDGDPQTPSVVHVPVRGEAVAGKAAQILGRSDPASTIVSIKRLLGRPFDDDDVRRLDAGVGYKIIAGANGRAILRVRNQEMTCEQVAAAVLTRLRDLAERRFGRRTSGAVMGVPAGASAGYIDALRTACRLAGLHLLSVIPEPIAGALAMGLHMAPAQRKMVVCDFGGGTFDVSLLEQDGTRFTPVVTSGDPFLGGDDLDDAFADGIAGAVYRRARFDMHNDAVRWQILVSRCESVKRMLSSRRDARLVMPDAYVEQRVRCDIDLVVDRDWLEPRWEPLIERALAVVERALIDACWKSTEIDELILIGGSSLVPVVRRRLSARFPSTNVTVHDLAHLAVATGAALQTAGHAHAMPNAPRLSAG